MTTTTLASPAPKSLFPDGLKTSGQHNPDYALLTPPSQFPKEVSGPTVWKAEDYKDHPERWTHVFSEEEIEELGEAAEAFMGSGRGLTGMAKVSFVESLYFDLDRIVWCGVFAERARRIVRSIVFADFLGFVGILPFA
jgi:hypothetical protein